MEEKKLEKRMYFFTIYQLMGIQKGIQCGHAAMEYARKYGNDSEFIDFADNWKTWIILNGGTTNSDVEYVDEKPVYIGGINQIASDLRDNDIKFSVFHEPDLDEILTAICFICDERVFNRKDYPDFVNWLLDIKMYDKAKDEANKNNPDLWVKLRLFPDLQQEMFPEFYDEWIEFLGGRKNVFLRELIQDKKLA